MTAGQFVFPTSFAQRRLWFVDRLEPESGHYNVSLALGLTGVLEVDALRRALADTVERHEALRTIFVVEDGEPVQVVGPPPELELPVLEVAGMSEDDLDAVMEEEAYRPFDLERGPLLRARLLRRGREDHVLLLSVHHIVFDGWSAGVLYRELEEGYTAHACGREPRLPELPLQYGDYAVWQREWLEGETLERQLAYWRTRLAGAPPALDLPLDRARPRVSTRRGAAEELLVPPATLQALTAVGRRHGVTLYMSLLAGFQALLARYAGTDDVTVGSPVANRLRVELEPLIGFFVNSLVLRTDLSGDPSFRELLARVRETSLGAFDHQDLPFEKLVEELRPPRIGDRNPVFQVMFAVQNAAQRPLRLPGLTVRSLRRRLGRSKFDLSFTGRETANGLRISLEYSTDLFDPRTICGMLRHLERFLEGVLSDPERRLSAVSLLDPHERRRSASVPCSPGLAPENLAVHRLFAEQAARRPDAIAVESGAERLTYGALDRGANRLARLLRSRGIGTGTRVAIPLDPAPETIVALLATLKTGAAYVPLEPGTGPTRMGGALEAASAGVLLTRTALFPVPPGVVAIALDAEADALARESDADLPAEVATEALACVLCSTGTDGSPETIGIPHRAIAHLASVAGSIGLTPGDRIAQSAGANRHGALFEIWGALLEGAQLILRSRDDTWSPDHLAASVREHGVTAVFLSAARFLQLVGAGPDLLRSLRLVAVEGPVELEWIREVLTQGAPERLVQVYGHAETGFAFLHRITALPDDAPCVALGEPVGGAEVRVLDGRLEPVPVGVPGELYVGGPGLACGYLNRVSRTADRFVPDPEGSASGARLFRTGDRARRRVDGALELLGRIQERPRAPGHAVGVGELEAALADHPAVQECAVVLREDLPGGRGLVAYVAPRASSIGAAAPPASASPREHLSAWWAARERDSRPAPARPAVGATEVTARRLLRCRVNRVLEVGCADEELLLRVAPHALRYVGTVSSPDLLERLRRRAEAAGLGDRALLLQRAPLDLGGIERESADLVILDSVVHALPSIDHLVRLLEELTTLLAPGGAIFVGDVRNLDLRDATLTAEELRRASPEVPTAELQRRIRSRVAAEDQLLVSPGFFTSLPQYLHEVRRVEVLPRVTGREDIAADRYDVLVHSTRTPASGVSPPPWTDWSDAGLTLDSLAALLRDERTGTVALARVPDALRAARLRAVAVLSQPSPEGTAADIMEESRTAARAAIHPADLVEVGESLGYGVELSWARWDGSPVLDVLFHRPTTAATVWPPTPRPARLPWHRYANQPRLRSIVPPLVPAIRAYLRDRIPEYLVPRAVVLLETLPRSPDGTTDLAALPAPLNVAQEDAPSSPGPQTQVERELAELWCRLLGVMEVRLEDDFFELGGHSLLAIKLFAEIERTFGRKLPLSTLFQAPTLGGLAEAIGLSPSAHSSGSAVSLLQSHGDRPPLFLVHGPEGDVLEYRPLVKRLGDEQPVYGLEMSEAAGPPAPQTIEMLAAGYVAELRRVQPVGPYHLCGYCWAGMLAMEIAQQLLAAGESVALLALIDAPSPGRRRRRQRAQAAGTRPDLRTRIVRGIARMAELERSAILRFVRAGALKVVTEVAGVPAFRWSVRAGRPLLPAFQGRRQRLLYAGRAYRARPYPGRVTLVRATSETEHADQDPLWGWGRVAAGGIDLYRVPGTHMELIREPKVALVADIVRQCLAASQVPADAAPEVPPWAGPR